MKFFWKLLALAMLIMSFVAVGLAGPPEQSGGRDLSSGRGGDREQPVGGRWGLLRLLDNGTLIDLGETDINHGNGTAATGQANQDTQPPAKKKTRKRKLRSGNNEDDPEQQTRQAMMPRGEWRYSAEFERQVFVPGDPSYDPLALPDAFPSQPDVGSVHRPRPRPLSELNDFTNEETVQRALRRNQQRDAETERQAYERKSQEMFDNLKRHSQGKK